MSLKINYSKKNFNRSSSNLVIFADEKFNLRPLKSHLSNPEFLYISDLLKTYDLKKNLFFFEVSSKKKIILISIKKNHKNFDIENLGAEFFNKINVGKNNEYFIISDSVISNHDNFLSYFLHF